MAIEARLDEVIDNIERMIRLYGSQFTPDPESFSVRREQLRKSLTGLVQEIIHNDS